MSQNLWTDSVYRSHMGWIAHHTPSAQVLQKKGGVRFKDGFKHYLIIFFVTPSSLAWFEIQIGWKQCDLIRKSNNIIKADSLSPGKAFFSLQCEGSLNEIVKVFTKARFLFWNLLWKCFLLKKKGVSGNWSAWKLTFMKLSISMSIMSQYTKILIRLISELHKC